ncbi:hypothetical protein [Luteibacter sp. E-22]|uniref:hypothetical protein n=1 Tax=Luteibacter sp. E-22 TaxID=3404050 RepID=UPI003CF403F5
MSTRADNGSPMARNDARPLQRQGSFMPISSIRHSWLALLCGAAVLSPAMAQSAQPRAVFAAHVDAAGQVISGTDWVERVDVVYGDYRPSFYTVRPLPGAFATAPICSVSLIHETDLQDVIGNVAVLKAQPTPYEVLVRISATRMPNTDPELLNRQAFDLVCTSMDGAAPAVVRP